MSYIISLAISHIYYAKMFRVVPYRCIWYGLTDLFGLTLIFNIHYQGRKGLRTWPHQIRLAPQF